MTMKARTAGSFAIAAALTVGLAGPAVAGQWVSGGTFDPERGVAVAFLRYLAGEGEGQMTIRCDELDGLWVDAGAAGNGELPEGRQAGDLTEVVFSFVQEGGTYATTLMGELLVRNDGAVLASIFGEAARPLAELLVQPAERVDITIGDITRPVTLDGAWEDFESLSARCDGWPE